MTLGNLIKKLEDYPNKNKIVKMGFNYPHSYRGYYEELAFEPCENIMVKEMLFNANGALNNTFYGYKGGEYFMDESNRCWIAEYGHIGEELGDIFLNYMLNIY